MLFPRDAEGQEEHRLHHFTRLHPLEQAAPVVGAGATVGVIVAGAGGGLWLLDKRGLINLRRILRRE